MSVYLPPSLSLAEVETRLEGISAALPPPGGRPVIIAGDFNAYAVMWGSARTNARGALVLDWAATNGLVCMNRGRVSTCVRPQGESIVDITWASPSAARVLEEWSVLDDVETMSDHRYIECTLLAPGGPRDRERAERAGRRWSTRKLDPDRLTASLLASSWPQRGEADPPKPLRERVRDLRGSLADACDFAMPRAKFRPKAATYWWSADIEALRGRANRRRRVWTRARRRQRAPELIEESRAAYKEAKKALGAAICRAKNKAWKDLLSTLDEDPWGLAYKLVREKLRRRTLPVTENMDPELLDSVISTLFPDPTRPDRYGSDDEPASDRLPPGQPRWEEEWSITPDEISRAIRRMTDRKAAPGPDGVPARAVALACKVIGGELRDTLTECLREGVFPSEWRRANLVLLRKDGRSEDLPSSYRPICLLDELGKILERVIAGRVQSHLAGVGPDLHHRQFGFRWGRSTTDAILLVKNFVSEENEEGRVVLAVSLDITNAFNTLPWDRILEAASRHGLPTYLKRVLEDYLRDRRLDFRDRTGALRTKNVRRGVPQGSVLGPLLWDLGFDRVLSGVALPPHCVTVCYADDTLVLAAGDGWAEALSRANEALVGVVGVIKSLDLGVAPAKTEAVFMHGRTRGPPPAASVRVDGTSVPVGDRIRYLGLVLDARWSFKLHFERLAPRLDAVIGQCARLMPNLGGPGDGARHLYANAVTSVALYGAPVWAEEAYGSAKIRRILRAAQRRMAIRVIRGYRTVSFPGATLLAGLPPWELTARSHAEIFRSIRDRREGPGGITPWHARAIRALAKKRLFDRWEVWLGDQALSGRRVREAIRPMLAGWVGRGQGRMSFRLTQILTGHGCFGEFLYRIGKEDSPGCHHCPGRTDSAQHTLEECAAWGVERGELQRTIGGDLSLPSVVRVMLRDPAAWKAVVKFAERVLLKKEGAERQRRGEGPRPPPPNRGRRRGRRNARP